MPLDTYHTNRLLLILFGALALLSFMDLQARRHYQARVTLDPDERLESVRENLARPIRARAESVLQGVDEVQETVAEDAPARISAEALSSVSPLTTAAEEAASGESIAGMNLRPLDAVDLQGNGIDLYFLRFRNARSELVRVRRPAQRGSVSLRRVLEELQRGPGPRERGLLNMFDEQIEIRGVRLEGGIAVVDLSEELGRMGNHVIADRLDQLAYTLTQFSGIRGVRVLVNGESVRQLGAGALEIPDVLKRGDRSVIEVGGR